MYRPLAKSPSEILYGVALVTPSIWENQPVTIGGENENFLEKRNSFLTKKTRSRFFAVGDYALKALAETYTALIDRNVGRFEITSILRDVVYEITDTNGNSVNVHSNRLTRYSSAKGMVPIVRTRQARSTLPALTRHYRGKSHDDVLF
ncbi:hypothetical protein AYI69_g10245 [Smittium culicis]|uniref:Uncharacterized protein n=1 Tax=Smittium culicis TaxID=133412 RepID=A0A1R1X707_9FUNG|nr:hypothetical protein AYI69_g10245 [Smittium culicis]